MSSLAHIRQMAGGIIAGLSLKMTLAPKTVTTDAGKLQTIYMVNIEFDGGFKQLREAAVEIAKIRGTTQVNLTRYIEQAENYLTAPETEEDQSDINEEFSPQTVDAEVVDKKAEPEKKKEPEKKDVPVGEQGKLL